MHRDERRRKFHEAIVHMLYPQPPPPPQQEDVNDRVNTMGEFSNLDDFPGVDDVGERSSSLSEATESEDGASKLTRAQRKRLRKKMIKKAASRRREIIGPLLPSASDDQCDPPDVRPDAAEEPRLAQVYPSEGSFSCNMQNKLKHRRMAKRLARERAAKTSAAAAAAEDCGQVSRSTKE